MVLGGGTVCGPCVEQSKSIIYDVAEMARSAPRRVLIMFVLHATVSRQPDVVSSGFVEVGRACACVRAHALRCVPDVLDTPAPRPWSVAQG